MRIQYRKVKFADTSELMWTMSPEHLMSLIRTEISDDFIRNRVLHLIQTGKPVRLLGNLFVPEPWEPIEMVTQPEKS